MKSLRLALLAAIAVLAAFPAGAGAKAVHKFDVKMPGAQYQAVSGANATGKWTVRVVRANVEIYRNDRPVGSTAWSFSLAVQPGDVFEIDEYGAADPVPPVITPDETFVVPTLTVDATVGSPVVSGAAPDGTVLRVSQNPQCGMEDSYPATQAGGVYSLQLPMPVRAGDAIEAIVRYDGDRVEFRKRVPGDAQCFYVDARRGTSTSANPYGVEVYGLDTDAIGTTRVVVSRNGAPYADENDFGINLPPEKKPLPGDVIDVYRPKDAPAPAYSRTVPAIASVFDPGNDLAAVDSPGGFIRIDVCRAYECDGESSRAVFGAPAGRTIFDFKLPGSEDPPFDLRADDVVALAFVSPDYLTEYSSDVSTGDLTPPSGKLTLAKRVKLAKLRSVLKFKLNSSEAGIARAKLTFKQKRKGSKKSREVTLGSVNRAVVAGNNTLSLKLTKKGKKLVKQLRAGRKSQTGTVSVTLTDGSGNVTRIVKRTKLLAR